MKILGIDPGTARLGYAFVDVCIKGKRVKVKLLKADTLITKPDLEQHKRLKFLYKSLQALIKEFSPDTMVIEKLFFNTNAKTAINVGQARGISLLAAADKNMNVFEYTALEAKFVLTGYGRSDKKQMQEAVKDILKLESIVKSDDANDAVAMALCFTRKAPEYLK
jgi:crossover junction endodeoxyribonuclease RuvC